MTNDWELHQVTLSRTSGFGLGMAVAGGVDSPYIVGDSAVVVSDVLRDGPAEGKLCVGDRLLSVNGISLLDVTHSFAIKQLKIAGNTVDLVVHRRVGPSTSAEQALANHNGFLNDPQSSLELNSAMNTPLQQPEVVLARRGTWEELGMHLGFHLFVSGLTEGSLAQREGLRVGDLITSVNGIKTDHISLVDAVNLLSRRDEVRLGIQRPNENATLRGVQERLRTAGEPPISAHISSGQLSNHPGSQPMSTSSRLDMMKQRSWDRLDAAASPQIHPASQRSFSGGNAGTPRGRRVAFQREPLRGTGLRIVGGNASGIFVASVEHGSPAETAGLREGDRILKVGSLDTQMLTKEEAALELIGQEGLVEMTIAPSPNEYSRLLSSGESGDSLFVRVHFDYRGSSGGGGSTSSSTSSVAGTGSGVETGFRRGEIFHVLDTLHGGVVGSWRALRVHPPSPAGATEVIIPNENRAQQLALTGGRSGPKYPHGKSRHHRPSRSSNHSFILRRKRSKSANPSAGGVRNSADPPSVSSASSVSLAAWERAFFGSEGPSPEPFPPYERVVHRHPGFIRPVIVFGPLADVARERLSKELPEKFAEVTPPENDATDGSRSSVIKLSSIRQVTDSGRHAVLDITPGAVQRLNFAQMAPIVLFMRPDGKSVSKELRTQYARYSGRHGKRLLEETTSMEGLASHLFTGVVPITSGSVNNNHPVGLSDWFTRLVETVEHQQREPTWITSEPTTTVSSPRLNTRRPVHSAVNSDDETVSFRAMNKSWANDLDSSRLSAPNLIDRSPDRRRPDNRGRITDGTLTRSVSDPHMLSPPKAAKANAEWQFPEDSMQTATVGRIRGRMMQNHAEHRRAIENFMYLSPNGTLEQRRLGSSSGVINDFAGQREAPRDPDVDPYAIHTLPGRKMNPAIPASGTGDGYATVKPRAAVQQQQQAMNNTHDMYRYVRSSAMTSSAPNRADFGLPGPKHGPPVAPKPQSQRSSVPQMSMNSLHSSNPQMSVNNLHSAVPQMSNSVHASIPQTSGSFHTVAPQLSANGLQSTVPQMSSTSLHSSNNLQSSGPPQVSFGSHHNSGPSYSYQANSRPQPVSSYQPQVQPQPTSYNSSAQLRLQPRNQPAVTESNSVSRNVYGHRLEPIVNLSSTEDDSHAQTSDAMQQQRKDAMDDLEIVAEKSGLFDNRGGTLESIEHGVSLRIPPGAFPVGAPKKEVYFKIYRETGVHFPHTSNSKTDETQVNGVSAAGPGGSNATLVSPLVMCGPHGLRFHRPVELRMPHRPDLRPENWHFSLLHSSSETGQPGRWQETRVGGQRGTTPRVLDNGQISVMVDHF